MRDDVEVRLAAWLQDGPEQASDAFVDATFAPLPYLGRRRAWRVRLGRLLGDDRPSRVGGALRFVAVAAILVVALAAIAIGGGGLGPPPPSPSPVTPAVTFTLTTRGGPPGPFHEAEVPGLATCAIPDGEPWRLIYAGGSDPFISLDVLVGDGAATAPNSNQVAAEIQLTAPDFYVRFDPAILRGGDGVGRSTAAITVTSDAAEATMTISAVTPDRTSGADGDPVTIDLFVACRR